jgi:protein phosphatase
MKAAANSITFHPPVFIQGQGKRENQEDAYFPGTRVQQRRSRCFVVCDGVGGQRKGEVASQLLARDMGKALNKANTPPDEQLLLQALRQAEVKMQQFIHQKPACAGMATTLTVLLNAGEQLITAHVGDSRIYHFRQGKILYRSTDHSIVSFLMSQGNITEEEAATHPQRNVITRSVTGVEAAEPDVYLHSDVRAGDFFLLCTDGILEAWPDKDLQQLFHSHSSADLIARQLTERCAKSSKDNYTACILQVQQAPGKTSWWKKLFNRK